jgi:hypothetical protein
MKEEELLVRFKDIINRGFVPAIGTSNASVGRTLEKLLNLKSNNSFFPDFGEIELKSIIHPIESKFNKPVGLFSQVPDWKISGCVGINDFFDKYHYNTKNKRQLFTTVCTKKVNSCGLRLEIDDKNLYEIDGSTEKKLLVWNIEKLWEKLVIKHSKTFWIYAEKKQIGSRDYFHYHKIEYTANPIKVNFLNLICSGEIQLDHCISETKNGKAKERGPSFRILLNSRNSLFDIFRKDF